MEGLGRAVAWRLDVGTHEPDTWRLLLGDRQVANGKQISGVRDADNPKMLRAQLKREGVLLTEATEEKSDKKKAGRREYVRVSLRRAQDGRLEAIKFPREGAGLLSSLVETDGLVELGESVTGVEPGQGVGFLSYADLL